MEQVVANGGNGALKAQFSFYMSANPDAPSKLVFGDYDLAKYAKKGSNDTDIVWFDTTKDNVDMWALAVSSITFSGSEDQVNVQSENNYIMVDSGTSFALAPKADFDNLVKMLLEHKITCTQPADPQSFYQCICPSALCIEAPSLEFNVKTQSGETKNLTLGAP